ncbi:MAG: hypothetical protein ACOY90_07950 [Candidatus Zhuqueibacterota bacterium]
MDMISNRILGQILAYLEYERTNGAPNHPSILADHEADGLAQVRNRMLELQQRDYAADIFAEIPDTMCNGETNFLGGHIDFYLEFLAFGSPKKNAQGNCERIFSHLNTCYRCFEDFSQVMRNYYYKQKELVDMKAK